MVNAGLPPHCKSGARMCSGVLRPGNSAGRSCSSRAVSFLHVLLIPTLIPPGEVGAFATAGRPTLPRACIIAGLVNASARNSTSDRPAEASPSSQAREIDRLGMRIVDPEDPDARGSSRA